MITHDEAFNHLDCSIQLNKIGHEMAAPKRNVFVIDDLDTLKAISDPTRVAIIELLAEPRSVTQLAETLDVPRTRLYHHIELLQSKGVIQQVEERRVGALTERIYDLTAKTYRPSARLLRRGDQDSRVDALMTLVFDTTKSDLKRAIVSGEAKLGEGGIGVGRTIANLSPARAAEFLRELEALVARFDEAHGKSEDARPFAFVWAMYPSSRRIR
jgi:DNA-binding transcriptional ArsR family regulator